jgi:hypothetical protein
LKIYFLSNGTFLENSCLRHIGSKKETTKEIAMGGRQGYKDSTEFMNWYNNLDADAKKRHNRKRYLRSKVYLERQAKKLAKKNKVVTVGNLMSKVEV